jgi:hypothetical protein
MVTHSEMWYHYVPESGNWHDGTFTRRIAALSAAPNPCCHNFFEESCYDISANVHYLQPVTNRYLIHRMAQDRINIHINLVGKIR